MKLDFGCGKNPRDGFEGVDVLDFGQKWTVDLGVEKWPWEDNSVEEGHSSHFLEHLEQWERVHFFNELWRVMKVGAKTSIIVPDMKNDCAYGDPTHCWPAVSPFFIYYLLRDWRAVNAPHTNFDRPASHGRPKKVGYTCNFSATSSWNSDPRVAGRNIEYLQHGMNHWWNVARDYYITVEKLP